MKSLVINSMLLLYADLCVQSNTLPDSRDIDYITRRFENEGVSFLTITLPTFARALERGLEYGFLHLDDLNAFGRCRTQSLPRFLSGLTRRIFSNQGILLDDPCVNAIYAIRQLTLFYKKVNLSCTEERVDAAIEKFVSTDNNIRPLRVLPKSDLIGLRRTFESVFGMVLAKCEESVSEFRHVPRHGTGAVSEKLSRHARYVAKIPQKLLDSFPVDFFFCSNFGSEDEINGLEVVSNGDLPLPRLVTVPKTLKTPRLISIEPASMQFCQQSLMRLLVDCIESSPLAGRVGFRDQSVNAQLARLGSVDRRLATLDLSEASDRVSASLVSYLFKSYPNLRRALFACRSPAVKLPSGATHRLRKFASMGSATTFPVEGMVFYAIACYSMYRQKMLTSRRGRRYYYYSSDVYVYGDDIIVPTNMSVSVSLGLQFFGMKVNSEKSFSEGFFRESCGLDAYKGYVVTPVYMRTLDWTNGRDLKGLASVVSTINQLHKAGLWRAADGLRKIVERLYKYSLPVVYPTSSLIGLHTRRVDDRYTVQRYNRSLNRHEVRGYCVIPNRVIDPVEESKQLLKYYLESNKDIKMDFESSSKRGDFRVNRRWCTPF